MSIFKDFISIFYPELCASCGNALTTAEDTLCLDCIFSLPETNFHLHRDNQLEKLFWGKVKIDSAVSMYYYSKGGKIQNLIHKMKYSGYKEIAYYFGKEYGNILIKQDEFKNIDFIIPVPLHKSKMKKRGYNQSEYFAKGLSGLMKIPYNACSLIAMSQSQSQTHKKRYERWQNVKEIFDLTNSDLFTNKHVLLVDDIITTGSTIESCMNVLSEVEGIRMSVASIAFAGI